MALTSTAKISDVVNVLNDVQGLNQKAELVSVVNDMGSYENEVKTDIINAINTKNLDKGTSLDSNSSWQALPSAILSSKNVDIGEIASDGSYYINIIKYSFTPKIVMFWLKSSIDYAGDYNAYRRTDRYRMDGGANADMNMNGCIVASNNIKLKTQYSNSVYNYLVVGD